MNLVQTAAYDPLFWLHHSFIDKVWADRQNNPDLPQMTNEELKDTMLEPFRGSNLKITLRNLITYAKTVLMRKLQLKCCQKGLLLESAIATQHEQIEKGANYAGIST